MIHVVCDIHYTEVAYHTYTMRGCGPEYLKFIAMYHAMTTNEVRAAQLKREMLRLCLAI
jgi:hypothetical protein